MPPVATVLLVSMLLGAAASAQTLVTLADRLTAVRARAEAGALAEAAPLAERLRDDAEAANDLLVAALASRTLGSIRLEQERFAEARAALIAARDRLRALGQRRFELEAELLLARIVLYEGDHAAALAAASPALAELERLGLPRPAMAAAYSQMIPVVRRGPPYEELMRKALAHTRPDDRFPAACSIWQSEGDRRFNDGDYVGAHESLTAALDCYEGLGRRAAAGRVLVSLGRVQRAHGQLQNALANYVRAAAMQKAAGDIPAWLQSLNAQAVTYDRLLQPQRAERLFREALAVARAQKLRRYETFLQGNLAGSLMLAGHTRAALAELLAVLPFETSGELRAVRHRQIATAYIELAELPQALEHLELARTAAGTPVFDEDVALHNLRGTVLAMQGDLDGAQHELDASIRLIEEARARALAADSARRGFGDLHQETFAATIDVAMRRRQGAASLEMAEQARARALLDLVNARDTAAAIPPPKVAEMQDLARRLQTTLLVYWVAPASTFAWVVDADGVAAHRLPIGERRLRALVRRAAGAGDVPGAINAALLGTPDLSDWRRLHRALVAPLRASLPSQAGSRLTIVPHGPLLHLPFAGLLDTTGRYLVERYVIHYAPSVAVLQAATRGRLADAVAVAGAAPVAPLGRALVLGDPAPLPRLPGVQLPPPLPRAREEARGVARQFPAGAMLSIGGAATEQMLRSQLAHYGWLHVATHARVAEEATSPSYLLLARGAGGPNDDGLLTADEVTSLPLTDATVVLSACGTALGRVTGEGTLGFTRSFLAAGARTVVATMWEMPDTAGLRMMNGFYAQLRANGNSVSVALREAQLRELRALRAGRVTMKAGTQTVRLPSTPLLWAGYVAVGVP